MELMKVTIRQARARTDLIETAPSGGSVGRLDRATGPLFAISPAATRNSSGGAIQSGQVSL
jgi:hypothetical protein